MYILLFKHIIYMCIIFLCLRAKRGPAESRPRQHQVLSLRNGRATGGPAQDSSKGGYGGNRV